MKLTRLELEIMEVFWEMGRAAIREVQEALPERRRPAYTTVQTIVRRLEEKGAVRQVKKIGNALIFEPVVTREEARGRWVDELLELFGGSPRPLMAHLVETGRLDLEDVREIERMPEEQEGEAEPKGEAGQKGEAGLKGKAGKRGPRA